MADTVRRSWLQFTLRTLCWLMFCIAIGITAYRRGYDAGFAERGNQRSAVGNVYAAVYYVIDVVPANSTADGSHADYAGLIKDLTTKVLPNTWVDRGGTAAVKAFATNSSIVVSHDQDGHEHIANYLELRRGQNENSLLSAK